MTTNDKEIIDLTEDREVIVLESEDEVEETPSGKHAREPIRSTSTNLASEEINDISILAVNTAKKIRRGSRKKKRKVTVVGAEEGEIVELDVEESVQVSREESREQTEVEVSVAAAEIEPSKVKPKDSSIRTLLERLADADERTPADSFGDTTPSGSKSRKKKNKKRKREDKEPDDSNNPPNGEDALPNANGTDDPLGPPLFFIDEKPGDIPTSAKFSAPSSVLVNSGKPDDKKNADAATLLLPNHVSVFEGDTSAPIQIIAAPIIDSDDEDYIEYLDYDDDRRVRCILLLDFSHVYEMFLSRLVLPVTLMTPMKLQKRRQLKLPE
jgi:protein AIR1/2